MNNSDLEWNGIIWNELELFAIKMNEQECSRSAPTKNVPLHLKKKGNIIYHQTDSNSTNVSMYMHVTTCCMITRN